MRLTEWEPQRLTAVRGLTWAVLALAISAVCLVVALPLGSIVDGAFGESAVARLSVAAGAWPLLASVTTTAAAWLVLEGSARRAVAVPLLVAILGSFASAMSAAALVMWTDGHFGTRFDPEYIGPNVWLPVLAGVVTVGATWMLGLKGSPARFGVLCFAAAGALIALLALLNLPGLLDGVTARGIPLMLAFASAGMVVLGGLALSVRVSDPAVRGAGGPTGSGRGGPRGA